ncbi:MAG: hypothetical protein WD208_10020 [Dehalococcoidia bacterium]
MTLLQLAVIGAAALISGVALFQAALALGLPLGEATFGGRAPTRDGVLTPTFRVIAAISGLALILFASVFLARADVISIGFSGDRFVYWATWVIVGFLILNTIGNLAAPHPVERWVMGPITLTVAVIGIFLALSASA